MIKGFLSRLELNCSKETNTLAYHTKEQSGMIKSFYNNDSQGLYYKTFHVCNKLECLSPVVASTLV